MTGDELMTLYLLLTYIGTLAITVALDVLLAFIKDKGQVGSDNDSHDKFRNKIAPRRCGLCSDSDHNCRMR